MPRRSRASKRRRRRTPRRKPAALLRRWLWYLGAVALLLGAGYLLYVDYMVRHRFEDARWALPARVYASPLELYVGRVLDARTLAAELRALGYQSSARLAKPGDMQRRGSAVEFYARAFQFWDALRPAQRVRVDFDDDQVSALQRADDAAALTLLRVEPALIGRIYPASGEDRVLVRVTQTPPLLIEALLAVEDRQFYQHHGVSPSAVARAALANLRAGATVQGGSTLTQQLVKNMLLTRQRTVWRKLNEALMAVLLEWHYSKPEILEGYLNEIYLGQEGQRAIHGFGLASQFYFGRRLDELEVHQMALLVGMVKGPSLYNPRRHPERARERRNLVLELMRAQGVLSAAQADAAQRRELGVTARAPRGASAHPAFLDLVRRQLRRDYRREDLATQGLRIFTTLDIGVQRVAERAVAQGLNAIESQRRLKRGTLQAAAVVSEREGGAVLAVVGGRAARFAGFNRALDAVRPIGSLVKPAVYLAALERGVPYTLVTRLDDTPLRLTDERGQPWTPQNYDRQFHGPVALREALVHSYNVPTVRLGQQLGVDRVVAMLRRLGIQRELHHYPSLVLGTLRLSPLEVTQMYQTLAGRGFRAPLRAIREITDADGTPLQRYPLTVEAAVAPGPVYLLNTVLQDVVREGTGRPLLNRLPASLGVAGKTGTTDDTRDSWFAGFTGDRLAVVWVGRDDNGSTGLTGSTGALPLWGRIIGQLSPQPLALLPPEDVALLWVERDGARLADEDCAGAVQVAFLDGTAPRERAPCAGGSGNPLRRLFDWLGGD